MCLTTNLTSPKKADEDKKVYKVLYRDHDGKYYAPVVIDTRNIRFIYEKGMNFPYVAWRDEEYTGLEGERYISSGWLHAYNALHEAVRMMKKYNCEQKVVFGCGEYVIVEMTIPKESEYYVSEDMLECCSKVLEWDGNIFMEDNNIKRIDKKICAYL